MDDGVTAELRALRARAWGADADIAGDPAAMARLAELEAAERTAASAAVVARSPEPEAEPEYEPEPEREHEPERAVVDEVATLFPQTDDTAPDATDAAADAGLADGPADVPARDHGRGSRPPKRLLLTWAGSLALVAVVAVAVTSFTTARSAATATSLPDDAQITHVTTLLPTGAELPEFLQNYGTPGGRGFEPFAGFTAYELMLPVYTESTNQRCVFVVDTKSIEDSTNDSWSGSMYQGCSAGAFPAAAMLTVSDRDPQELRDRYPRGTALQFVLRDDGVDVFVSEAPTTEATD